MIIKIQNMMKFQAAQISKNFNTRSFFHYEDSKKFKDLKTNILKNMDQPSIDGINTYLISRYANFWIQSCNIWHRWR